MATIRRSTGSGEWYIDDHGSGQVTLLDASGNPIDAAHPLACYLTTPAGGLDVNLAGDEHDLDTGGGTDSHAVVAIGLPASGGHVVAGTSANPLRTDPTGTTNQPVTVANPTDVSALATASKQDTQSAKLDSVISALSTLAGYQDGVEGLLSTLTGKDFATQTTLAAVLAKLIAAPATEAKQDTINTNLGVLHADIATTLLAELQQKLESGQGVTLQVAGSNVGNANPVAVSDAGGSLTVDGTVAVTATDLDIRNLAHSQDIVDSIVKGAASGNFCEVDGGVLAQRVSKYPKHTSAGVGISYSVRGTTGILAAALAAGAALFGIRQASSPTKSIYITQIRATFACVVAFTTGSQVGFVLERFSVANLAGGTAFTPLRHDTSQGASEAQDIRAATIAALTVTGVTFQGFQTPIIDLSSPTLAAVVPPVELDYRDNPIRLQAGEGLAVRNLLVWPVAGAGVLGLSIKWEVY